MSYYGNESAARANNGIDRTGFQCVQDGILELSRLQDAYTDVSSSSLPPPSHTCTPSCSSSYSNSQIEACVSRYAYSADEAQRYQSMCILQSLYMELLLSLLHHSRFRSGHDDWKSLSSNNDIESKLKQVHMALLQPTVQPYTESSIGPSTTSSYKLARRVESISHPFATSSYEYSSEVSLAASHRQHHHSSNQASHRARQRSDAPRLCQCLLSSIIDLLRLLDTLTARMHSWQQQIVHLPTAIKASPPAASTEMPPRNQSPVQSPKIRTQLVQPSCLEDLSPAIYDKLMQQAMENCKRQFQVQIESVRSENNILIKENSNLHRDVSERLNYWESKERTLTRQIDELKLEREQYRHSNKLLEQQMDANNAEQNELSLRLSQHNAHLSSLNGRSAELDAEWEQRRKEWNKTEQQLRDTIAQLQQSLQTALDRTPTVSVSAPAPCTCSLTLSADRAKIQSEMQQQIAEQEKENQAQRQRERTQMAERESYWQSQLQLRDEKERALSSEATRAKAGHRATLKECEELRNQMNSSEAEMEIERKGMEDRLRLSNQALSEARALIVQLKSNLKKFQQTAEQIKVVAADKRIEAEQEEEKKEIPARDVKKKPVKQKERKDIVVEQTNSAPPVASVAAALENVSTVKSPQKPKKRDKPTEPPVAPPKLPPPSAEEVAKPTPKLSSGYGRCVYEPNEWYEGWWLDFERHGQGIYQWKDGRRYEGEWHKDRKHGRGTYCWCDGDRYEGEYHDDKMDGYGCYYFSDGTRYEGNWSQDQSHGQGTFLYADGARYEGCFHHDQKHGVGKMHLPNGDVFEENWSHGKRISSVNLKQLPPALLVPTPPQSKLDGPNMHGLSRIRQAAKEALAQSTISARRR